MKMAVNFDWQDLPDRKASGAMLRQLLRDNGMNQTEGARYLGISLRTMRRFTATRKNKAPTSAILLLRLMRKHDELPYIPPKKQRKRRRK